MGNCLLIQLGWKCPLNIREIKVFPIFLGSIEAGDDLMQEFALGEIIRHGFGLLVEDILKVVAIGAEFNRADLAEAEMEELLLAQGLHEQIAVVIYGSKEDLNFRESLLEVHSMIIYKKSGREDLNPDYGCSSNKNY